MLGITGLFAPDYTSICKLAEIIDVPIKVYDHQETLRLIIDSTGLKVSARKVKQHVLSKRRTWRKVQIAVDAVPPFKFMRSRPRKSTSTTQKESSDSSKISESVSVPCSGTAHTIKRRFITNSPSTKVRFASHRAVMLESIIEETWVHPVGFENKAVDVMQTAIWADRWIEQILQTSLLKLQCFKSIKCLRIN